MRLDKLEKFLGGNEFLKLAAATPSIPCRGTGTFAAEILRDTSVEQVALSDAHGFTFLIHRLHQRRQCKGCITKRGGK